MKVDRYVIRVGNFSMLAGYGMAPCLNAAHHPNGFHVMPKEGEEPCKYAPAEDGYGTEGTVRGMRYSVSLEHPIIYFSKTDAESAIARIGILDARVEKLP